MKKLMRLLAAVLALTMLCEMLPLAAFAQSDIGQAVTAAVQGIEEENSLSGSCGENATWEFDYSTLTISGTGAMEDYSFYDEAPWYEYMYYINRVVIQKGITSIGKNAFWDCEYLTGVTIPEGVESIGDYAFSICKRLRRITIPDGVTHIGRGAFWSCVRLVDITLPESATSIGEGATSIGDGAFEDCDAIENIALPSGMTSIAARTFSGCRALKNIVIPDGVTSIGERAFSSCGLTDIMIPENVEYIGEGAFHGCEKLESIVIPDGITSIGDYTFCECSSLTDITLPESVESIGKHAFEKSAITNITLSDKVTSIGESAFAQCNRLTDVYYGGSEEKWKEIDISFSNGPLINATIHYNYSGTEEKPSKEFTFGPASKADNFNFINASDPRYESMYGINYGFSKSSYYHLANEKTDQLLHGLSPVAKKSILKQINEEWGGSCYGMAIVAALHYIAPNRIPLRSMTSGESESVYELEAPRLNQETQNLINYYHFMQCLPTAAKFEKERASFCKKYPEEAIRDIVTHLQKKDPVAACLDTHEIVLLDIQGEDDDSYTISVYDPNSLERRTLKLFKNSVAGTGIKIAYISRATAELGGHNYDLIHCYMTSDAEDLKVMDLRNYFQLDDNETKATWLDMDFRFNGWMSAEIKVGSYTITIENGVITNYSPNLITDLFVRHIKRDTPEDTTPVSEVYLPQLTDSQPIEMNITATDNNDTADIILNDSLLSISTDGPVKLTYDESARTVDVKADDPTAVSLLMTQNTVNDSWPWHSWAVDTTGTTTLHAELDSEGLHLTGDGLTDAKYATENADTEQTSEGTVNVQPDETGKTSVTIINKNDGDTDDTEVKGEDKSEETTYTVTVSGGTASPAKAKEGETVTITAEKTDTFQNWTVVAGGITLENENLPTTTFTMGKENVVITANYSSGGNITPPSPGEPGQSPSDDGGAGIVLAIGAAATVAAGIGAIALMPVKVEGKVELADHTALPGAKIALLQNGKVVAQTTTDADGKFALKVKRGSYELTAAYTDVNGQLMHKTASFKAPAKNLTVTF